MKESITELSTISQTIEIGAFIIAALITIAGIIAIVWVLRRFRHVPDASNEIKSELGDVYSGPALTSHNGGIAERELSRVSHVREPRGDVSLSLKACPNRSEAAPGQGGQTILKDKGTPKVENTTSSASIKDKSKSKPRPKPKPEPPARWVKPSFKDAQEQPRNKSRHQSQPNKNQQAITTKDATTLYDSGADALAAVHAALQQRPVRADKTKAKDPSIEFGEQPGKDKGKIQDAQEIEPEKTTQEQKSEPHEIETITVSVPEDFFARVAAGAAPSALIEQAEQGS